MEIKDNKLYSADGRLVGIFDYLDQPLLNEILEDAYLQHPPIPVAALRKPFIFFGKKVQLKKLREEFDELDVELRCTEPDKQRILEESADLMYLVLQHLHDHGISMKRLLTQVRKAATRLDVLLDTGTYDQATGKKKK